MKVVIDVPEDIYNDIKEHKENSVYVGDMLIGLARSGEVILEHKSRFPAIIGADAEMFVDGKWVRGKIVNGYRFDDGIVTIEDANGKRYWCGATRTELYREVKNDN